MKNIKWYNSNITKTDIKHLKDFANEFGIKFIIDDKITCSGYAIVSKGIIAVSSDTTNLSSFISILCHEMCHYFCYNQGLYNSYHRAFNPRTKADKLRFRRVALKAERFVDQMGYKMCKDYFPGVRYKFGYNKPEDRERFYNEYLDRLTK